MKTQLFVKPEQRMHLRTLKKLEKGNGTAVTLFFGNLLVKGGIDKVDVLFIHLVLCQAKSFTDTIKVEWMRLPKERKRG